MFMKNKISSYLQLARLDKPIGIWLLLFPSLWAIVLTNSFPLEIIIIFTVGAIIMRSAGCVINDIWDRKIDAKITRTKNRPLASGKISLLEAIIFFIILSILGLFLLLKLNQNTVLLGVFFLGLVIIYPLMKRFFSIPQIFLAITFNAGALMATMAIKNELTLTAWLLFIACFFWTLAYDTVYAHQDKTDDLKIGVKSSAIAFGNKSLNHIIAYYSLMFILLITIAITNALNIFFYLSLSIAFILLIKKLLKLNLDNSNACLNFFKFNAPFGFLILISLFLGFLQI